MSAASFAKALALSHGSKPWVTKMITGVASNTGAFLSWLKSGADICVRHPKRTVLQSALFCSLMFAAMLQDPPFSGRFAVAPMLDWSDRHFRYFVRLLSKHAMLYSEMVTTGALIHGDAPRHLDFDPSENPLVLQLGGSNAQELAQCARLGEQWGYSEINLNVGCPSDRVQNNMIGACLMAHPQRVADGVKAMRDAVDIPVTVKHRIGINGRDSYEELANFVDTVANAGCGHFIVHARIAILEGLSPKENRDIPPLRYDIARQLRKDFPALLFTLNGGIKTLEACAEHLEHFDGVMLGREAYANPWLMREVDERLYGLPGHNPQTRTEVLLAMREYIERHCQQGGKVVHVTRHLLGIAQGFPGARRFRQLLSADIHRTDSPLQVFDQAIEVLQGR